jgi:hypothetical protein
MRPFLWFLLGVVAFPVVIGLVGFVYLKGGSHGFSARDKPMGIEKFAALQARRWPCPPTRRTSKIPFRILLK